MIRKILKTAVRQVNRSLSLFGVEMRRTGSHALSLHAALMRMRARLTNVNTVLDVGASDGRWTRELLPFAPHAQFVLIEANSIHGDALRRFRQSVFNVDFEIAAAGDVDGELYFDGRNAFGGVASHNSKRADRTVAATTLDSLVRRHGLKGPFLIKLDTHGFEKPILEGARETLRQADLVVLETYNFRIEDDSLRFDEMCAYMEGEGFRVLDLSDVMHRPGDGALWQFDLYFAPKSSPEFQSNRYGSAGHPHQTP